MGQVQDLEVVAIQGGDSVEYNHPSITYVVKCAKCGNVDSEKRTISLTRGVIEVATVTCAKCGHSQMIKIRYPRNN
ncbi:MAG: hypothetical protein AB7S48_15485 [Bacteroidales bacterium]